MTVSSPTSATKASSPNCVVRSLESQLVAMTTMMKSTSSGDNEDDNRQVVIVVVPMKRVRDMVLELSVLTGNLSRLFISDKNENEQQKKYEQYGTAMGQLLAKILELSEDALDVPSLAQACLRKIALNNKKYPVHLCKGKAGKYTEYSHNTGITKTDGQSTLTEEIRGRADGQQQQDDDDDEFASSFVSSIAYLSDQTRQFAIDRDWEQYHTPRNILLALNGELGELAELFQWKGDAEGTTPLSIKEHDKIQQELADVTIYLIRLADVTGISLSEELEKLGVE